jgi:N-acetylglucosamine malate deacetylase 1
MITFNKKTILIIAPHPDDEVLGCGGLIHRAKNEGASVYVIFLTVGTTRDFSKKGLSTQQERISELKNAASYLNLDGYRIAFKGSKHHLKLDSIPQKEIVDHIERGNHISLEGLRPDIVMVPPINDYNQDHRAAAHAAITATRPQPPVYKHFQPLVLTYEIPSSAWSTSETRAEQNFYVKLSQKDLNAKTTALLCYKSQLKNKAGPISVYGSESLAIIRGIQAGVRYAEAYFVKRLLV